MILGDILMAAGLLVICYTACLVLVIIQSFASRWWHSR